MNERERELYFEALDYLATSIYAHPSDSEYAEILVEHVDRNGAIVDPPDFGFPSESLWESDLAAAIRQEEEADARAIAWYEAHPIRRVCSRDLTVVTVHVLGTSETAMCGYGHRWSCLFGEHDGYVQTS